MKINGLTFIKTCSVCPEQYDVKDNEGHQVGYIRLRWGMLRCDYPDVGGETIYMVSLDDDFAGCFESDEQRKYHLEAIADKILKKVAE